MAKPGIPAIPSVPKPGEGRERFDQAVKEAIEIITSQRGSGGVVVAGHTSTSELAAERAASLVGFSPSGNLIATTVQTAIEELDTEKAKLAGDAAQAFTASTLTGELIGNAATATASTTQSTGDSSTNIATTAFVQNSRLPMFRNKLINGAMAIDQRNAGAAQTITAAAALAYTVDRWYAYCTGANVTGQRVAGSGTSQYRYRFTGAASVTAIGFAQRIEAINCYDLNNATATLSVDLANSVLTTVTWTAYYANSDDTFGTLASPTKTQIATGTFTVTSTVTNYSTQISIPSAATTGIEILFTVGAQTSGTWTIGNVQLESGSVATPFERRLVATELHLCQRYCAKVGDNFYGMTEGANYVVISGQYPVQMRVAPTAVTISGGTLTFRYMGTDRTVTSPTLSYYSGDTSGFWVWVGGSSGLTSNIPISSRHLNGETDKCWIVDAEL